MTQHNRLYTTVASCGAVLLLLMATGCNKFLDYAPDDRAQLNNIDAIAELMVGAYPDNTYQPLYEIRSDNAVDKGMRAWTQTQDQREIYAFQEQINNTYQDSPVGYWRALYWATSAANQALQSLDELKDLSPADKQRADEIRGEALMVRSYNGFMLAETFCRPYDPATAEQFLGVPYPTEPEDELIKQYERGNLKELFDHIVADFEEGYKLIGSNYKNPKYRFTKVAAAAYGTRLYRKLANWDKVIEMGTEALGSNPSSRIREYRKFAQMTYAGSKAAWTLPEEECNLMVASCLSRWNWQCGDSRYSVDEATWRTINPSSSFLGDGLNVGTRIYGNGDGGLYLNFAKHASYLKYTNAQRSNFYEYTGVVIFTGEEVLFNLAEAYAMKNNFDKANELMQIFVARWFMGYSPTSYLYKVTSDKINGYYAKDDREFKPYYPLTEEQTHYVKAITDLKRFAFVHEGLRWLDIRHYNLPVDHKLLHDNDKRTSEHRLEPGDPRYAYQLPSSVLGYNLEPNPGYEASKPID